MSCKSERLKTPVELTCKRNMFVSGPVTSGQWPVISRCRSSFLTTQDSAHCSALLSLYRRSLSSGRWWHARNWIIRPHLTDDCIHRPLDVTEKRRRINADPERHDDQRNHVGPLTTTQVS